MSIFTEKKALKFLKSGRIFYGGKGEIGRCINMNDTFAWAFAYGPYVPDDQLVAVAELFWRYGNAGLCYWCTICPDEDDRMEGSQFEDVQRGIDFVSNEETLRLSGKSSDERAFEKYVYTLGDRSTEEQI